MVTSRMLTRRRTVRALSLAAAVGALTLVTPTAAWADTSPQSLTFTTAETPAGAHTDWAVPEGVTSVTLTVTGGNGGSPNADRPGGRGAVVTATIAVDAGQALTITLGADGSPSGAGGAGFGAGGSGVISGGGGASSAVQLGDTVLIIAGGGGGASDGSAAGGGGAGGIPDGTAGSRRGGAAGAAGVGGIGVAPWGGPGGTGYFGSGGQVNGTEAGAGGGGGFGGGGASGAYGDGGGGGSYVADSATASYSSRLDDLVDGWVQLDYDQVIIEPSPTPIATQDPDPGADRFSIGGIPIGVIGIGAGVVVVLGGILLVIGRRQRNE